jgi:ketosteroid isomerase-like protein
VRRAVFERTIARSYGAFNREDLDALRPLYHRDCVWDWSHFEGWLTDPVTHGFDGLRRDWLVFREAWGDCRFEPSDFRDFGDRQMVTCWMRGSGSGSGVGVERTWWQVLSVRDGLLVGVANYSDRQEALDAAGLPE